LELFNNGIIIQFGKKPSVNDEITLNISYSNTDYFWTLMTYRKEKTGNCYYYYFNKTISTIQTLQIDEPGYWMSIGF